MDRETTITLTVQSLLEVVQTGAKNIEIAIMAPGKPMEVRRYRPCHPVSIPLTPPQMMGVEEIEHYVNKIEKEKQEEAAKKKARAGGTGSGTTRAPEEATSADPGPSST